LDGQSHKNILLCGPMANQPKEQLGTWVFDGDPELAVTPLEAFTNQTSLRFTYEPGLTYSREKQIVNKQKLTDAARRADVILYFCGEEAILSGEARCRADINLPGAQAEMMELLAATGKPVVMIVMAGRPLTIGRQVEQAAAVLYAFHGGTMAGPALLNLLTGQAVPSGKTPITFPKMVGQIPFYYNRLNSGRPSGDNVMLIDDIPVGCEQFSIGASSYWLETPVEPLFPFGYGLSYSTFEYGTPQLDGMTVSCEVKNTGSVDAAEVVQLYTRQLSGALARPIKELKGFQKVFIPAGESRTVSFTLTREDLGYWHQEYNGMTSRVWFDTDPTDFQLWIAPDSRCMTTPVALTLR